MRKQKIAPTIVKSLEELISDYDRPTLVRTLNSIKSDIGWKVLRAALVKESLNHNIYAQGHTVKTGEQIEAAYHTGISQALMDTATSIIDSYINILEANNKVTSEKIREDE